MFWRERCLIDQRTDRDTRRLQGGDSESLFADFAQPFVSLMFKVTLQDTDRGLSHIKNISHCTEEAMDREFQVISSQTLRSDQPNQVP